jgi:hypothetical protein
MSRRRLSCLSLLLILALANSFAAQTARRPLKLDDLTRFRNVGDPQISPDGQWVAYVVGTTDAKEDKSNSHIWMVNIDGSNDRQITFSNESESSPRWSPDGKYSRLLLHDPAKRAATRFGCSIETAARRCSSPNSKVACRDTNGLPIQNDWRS